MLTQDQYNDLPGDEVVWRYMNLDKLLALLATSKIHLTRLDSFDDPWEGELPISREAFVENQLRLSGKSRSWAEYYDTMIRDFRKLFFVNCWHQSQYESAALWDQYAGSAGLAIRSTVGRLDSLKTSFQKCTLRRVRYVDFVTGEPEAREVDVFDIPCFKRPSFAHEKELRIVVLDETCALAGILPFVQHSPSSLSLDVDLGTLIESIWLSPKSPRWLVPHVEELLRRFNLPEVEIRRSALYDPVIR